MCTHKNAKVPVVIGTGTAQSTLGVTATTSTIKHHDLGPMRRFCSIL